MAQVPPRIGELFAEVQGHHDNPIAQLLSAQALITELDHWLAELVAEGRGKGVTWSTIGHCLGVTPQAVQKRFKDKVADVQASITIDLCGGNAPSIKIGRADDQPEVTDDVASEIKKAVDEVTNLMKEKIEKRPAAKSVSIEAEADGNPISILFKSAFDAAHKAEEAGEAKSHENPIEVVLEQLRKAGDLENLAGIKMAMKVADDLVNRGMFFGFKAEEAGEKGEDKGEDGK